MVYKVKEIIKYNINNWIKKHICPGYIWILIFFISSILVLDNEWNRVWRLRYDDD